MKIIAKEIEMIASFKNGERPIPVRFKFFDNEQIEVIKVARIISTDEEKPAGKRMFIYRCQSIFGNIEKIYELKFEVEKCRWLLFKI